MNSSHLTAALCIFSALLNICNKLDPTSDENSYYLPTADRFDPLTI